MTPEQADPQVLMEDYIARLAVLEQTGVPGWSAEWHDAARLAGDALVAEGRVGLEALRLVLDAPTAPADTKWGAFQSLARSKRPDAIMSLVSVLRYHGQSSAFPLGAEPGTGWACCGTGAS